MRMTGKVSTEHVCYIELDVVQVLRDGFLCYLENKEFKN